MAEKEQHYSVVLFCLGQVGLKWLYGDGQAGPCMVWSMWWCMGDAWHCAWYGAWVDDVVNIHSMACVSGGITFETAKMTYSCIVK